MTTAKEFRGKLKREPSKVWSSVITVASDLYPSELIEDIELAYEDDLVDPLNISLDDVRRDLALGMDRILKRLEDDPRHQLVHDTIREMEWWNCFNPQKPVKPKPASFAVTSPIQRPQPKVGRNDPCPCGNGKKYKKCCGS